MKVAIFSEDSIPTIYNALCLWNATVLRNIGNPDPDALELIGKIEEEFPQLFKEGKVIYTP